MAVNLKLVADAMFYKKSDWVNIPESDKEEAFFIFNRYLSKKYPERAQLFNLKSIDKVSAMNIWANFMSDKPYPNWFWDKKTEKEKPKVSNSDFKLLISRFNIKDYDLTYLIENHFDFIKEELAYFKKCEQNK